MLGTPEGASQQQPKPQGGQDPHQGLADALNTMVSGAQALLKGMTDAGAPKEILQLAQTGADAYSQLLQAIGGGGQSPDQGSAQQGVAPTGPGQ